MTVEQLIQQGEKALMDAGVPDAKIDARLLLEYVLNKDRAYLLTNAKEDLKDLIRGACAEDQEDAEALRMRYGDLIEKRSKRIPLQHLTGTQDFMGLTFRTGPGALIPRQDTETLVEEAMKHLHDGMRILDLCTGSGCILISLLKYSNDCSGIGTDLYPEALLIAKKNAAELLPEAYEGGRLSFLEGDLFADAKGPFDLVISNPPYIESGVIPSLQPEVRDHDPETALDGGEDGLIFYRRIVKDLDRHLIPGGYVLFEIGSGQAEAVSGILKEAGFSGIEVSRDLAGNDRVVKAYLPVGKSERKEDLNV
ncbi:MAG: peptide chain release factor N(5)-glutamine methyltransferase [Lachnospiraceae bacterium]|nr:peptide chain release factor N(5)-glutamine methyltransferase [Lachnospiraceae bacterium]